MTEFELHPQLAADTLAVTELVLCRVTLMNDSQYPWCILVPRREGAREFHALAEADQITLGREIAVTSRALERLTGAYKMNVAALGNVVPQLHVHVIARFVHDAAWPAPVWGRRPPVPYEPDAAARFAEALREALVLESTSVPGR